MVHMQKHRALLLEGVEMGIIDIVPLDFNIYISDQPT